MKRIRLASLLPKRILSACARRFDTPGAFECSVEGSSFWMDAHYTKYARKDERKHNAGPWRQRCGVVLALTDDCFQRFSEGITWLAMCGMLVVLGFTLHYL